MAAPIKHPHEDEDDEVLASDSDSDASDASTVEPEDEDALPAIAVKGKLSTRACAGLVRWYSCTVKLLPQLGSVVEEIKEGVEKIADISLTNETNAQGRKISEQTCVDAMKLLHRIAEDAKAGNQSYAPGSHAHMLITTLNLQLEVLAAALFEHWSKTSQKAKQLAKVSQANTELKSMLQEIESALGLQTTEAPTDDASPLPIALRPLTLKMLKAAMEAIGKKLKRQDYEEVFPEQDVLYTLCPFLRGINDVSQAPKSAKRPFSAIEDNQSDTQEQRGQSSAVIDEEETQRQLGLSLLEQAKSETDRGKLECKGRDQYRECYSSAKARFEVSIKIVRAGEMDPRKILVFLQHIIIAACQCHLFDEAVPLAELIVVLLRESFEETPSYEVQLRLLNSLAVLGLLFQHAERYAPAADALEEAINHWHQIEQYEPRTDADHLQLAVMQTQHALSVLPRARQTRKAPYNKALQAVREAVTTCRAFARHGDSSWDLQYTMADAVGTFAQMIYWYPSTVPRAEESFSQLGEESVKMHRKLIKVRPYMIRLPFARLLDWYTDMLAVDEDDEDIVAMREAIQLYQSVHQDWGTDLNREIGNLQSHLGLGLSLRFQYEEAEQELRAAHTSLALAYCDEEADRMIGTLALVCLMLEQYEDAEHYARGREEDLNNEPNTPARTLSEMASLYGAALLMKGEPHRALPVLQRSVKIVHDAGIGTDDIDQEEDIEYLLAVAWLGVCHCALGNVDDSLRYTHEAVSRSRAGQAYFINSEFESDVRWNEIELARVLTLRAVALAGAGADRQVEALAVVDEALELMMRQPRTEASTRKTAYALRAHLLSAAGREAEAERERERARAVTRYKGYLHRLLSDVEPL
ncbi:hypothetical protein OC834_003745 [Tilletia horrida]|nr:hypothetical protein OC834_003745 [Tilletia horrida]